MSVIYTVTDFFVKKIRLLLWTQALYTVIAGVA